MTLVASPFKSKDYIEALLKLINVDGWILRAKPGPMPVQNTQLSRSRFPGGPDNENYYAGMRAEANADHVNISSSRKWNSVQKCHHHDLRPGRGLLDLGKTQRSTLPFISKLPKARLAFRLIQRSGR